MISVGDPTASPLGWVMQGRGGSQTKAQSTCHMFQHHVCGSEMRKQLR